MGSVNAFAPASGGRFRVVRELGAGSVGTVYEAFDTVRGDRVALKTLVRADPLSLMRFKGEFRSLADIAHPNLVALYDLFSRDDHWFFSMELVQGESILDQVRDARSLREAFGQLAEALGVLHESGHMHRDLKPSNVMVDTGGRTVVLDFGLVAPVREEEWSKGAEEVVGTPLYMAPEQTHRHQAPTTASDWYAYGVMLFQALTGRLPFQGPPLAVMGAKLTRDAPPVRDLAPDAPAALAELVGQLLAREPEQRPTGEEVLRCFQWRRVSRTSLRPTEVLVGRDREVAALDAAYDGVLESGSPIAVTVRGLSGFGKTSLLRHFAVRLREHARPPLVLRGRCHERERVPYKALDALVDATSAWLLGADQELVERVLPADLPALANAFPVLLRVGPLRARLEGAPEAHGHGDLRRRALGALGALFTNLASEQPLVLMVDDVQWGDVESAPLFGLLAGGSGVPLLLLLAYREEESSLPLTVLLESIRGASCRSVRVAELEAETCRDLASKLLRSEDGKDELAARIAREADGHPYLVHELVRYAVSRSGAQQATRHAISMSLDDVITTRIRDLSPEARRLLDVIGVAVSPLPQSAASVAADLGPDDRRAYVELRAGHFVRGTGSDHDSLIMPYHDRVRTAVHQGMSDEHERQVHMRIGLALDELGTGEPDELFTRAHHHYLAGAVGRETQVFELCRRAAEVAAKTYSYEQAHTHFVRAREVAEAALIALDREFLSTMARVSAMLGRAEEGIELYGRALDQTDERYQRVELHHGLSKCYLSQLDMRAADRHACEALTLLHQGRPRLSGWSLLLTLRDLAAGLWGMRFGAGAVSPEEQRRFQATVRLSVHLGQVAYYEMDRITMLQLAMRLVRPVSRLAGSAEVVEWSLLACNVLAIAKKPDWAHRLHDMADRVVQGLGNPALLARSRLYWGHALHFLGQAPASERELEHTLSRYGHLLESMDYYQGVADIAWNLLMRGHPRRALHWLEQGLKRRSTASTRDRLTEGHTYRCYAGPAYAIVGNPDEGEGHLAAFHAVIADSPQDGWRRGQYLAHRAFFLREAGAPREQMDEVIRAHDRMSLAPGRLPHQLRHFYVMRA